MKTAKKITATLLTFALLLGVFAYTPAVAAEDAGEIRCVVHVDAPFEEYYNGAQYVDLTSDDLKDDFGIGLSTDGKEGYTAIRAIAKMIRDYAMDKQGIKDTKKANEVMKNYISYDNGFINAFSNDGVHWNTGVFQENISSMLANVKGAPEVATVAAASGSAASGTSTDVVSGPAADAASGTAVVPTTTSTVPTVTMDDGYWTFVFNNQYSQTGVGVTKIGAEEGNLDSIVFTWTSTTGKYGQPDYDVAGQGLIDDRMADGDKYHGYALANTKTSFRVMKLPLDMNTFSFADKYVAVPGAVVSVYNDEDMEICSATADANGKFTLPKLAAGTYTIAAWDIAKNAAGYTYSKITRTEYTINMVKKPGVPKNVKAKKKGKKVTVTWKPLKDASDFYAIYASKKKNGKYKLILEANGSKASFKLAKKLKNMKYVKVQHYYVYEIIDSSSQKEFYGKLSKPAKIK